MKFFAPLALSLLILSHAHSAVLDKLPGPPGMPMTQGSMIHINVLFSDNATATFDVTLDPGVPLIAPLTYWSPGNTLDSMDPWYMDLDPLQGSGVFSGRFGFLLDTGNSDPTPAGTSLGIRLVSFTSGLEVFFYRSTTPKLFDEVFVPSHNYVLWSGTMWHPVFVMPSSTPYGSTVSATFEMFLADATNSGNVDYTTTAGTVPGYETKQFTLEWTAIPEPSTLAILCSALGLGALAWLRRRKSIVL